MRKKTELGIRWWRSLAPLALLLAFAACTSQGDETPSPTSEATAVTPLTTATPTSAAATEPPYKPPHNRPGPAMDTVYFKSFNVDRAPLHLQASEMDMYMFSLKTAAAQTLREDPNIKLNEAPATSLSIILNPAPAPSGQLNPFTSKQIRQALQYLVNREFIVSDIYQGSAVPMVTHLSPSDFDFLTVYDQVKASEVRYDPERARSTIQQEMTTLGAKLVEGKWTYEGRPVRLKFIIRVEDERRHIGDLLRVELEKAGFAVAASYQQFAPAVLSVYSSDPQAFEWHLYTEGWARSSPQRYDFATINQMAAPWQGNMPGWQEAGFWQYENAELDQLGQRIFTGNFANAQERDQLYRRMTEIALDESVRIGVATVINSFPTRKVASGITNDLVAGPRGPWSVREAYVQGKDVLTVGNLWVWTERSIWNPVGGFGDVYSNDIWRNLYDPPIWNHPFTGNPIPFRSTFQVETAGPTGTLAIPTDAVTWNATEDRWQSVSADAKATSKVTFDYSKYFSAKWHNGQPITMADVIYSIAQSHELAYDASKSRIEFALGVTSLPYLNTIKGYRIVDANRLEVYANFWHFDDRQIASYAAPTGLTTPWELLAAMDDLVFVQRRAAYSDTAAARFNVPWLSLVIDRDARLVVRTLKAFLSNSTLPQAVFKVGNTSLVSSQEAQSRYQAGIGWFDKYGLLVISNGPYILTRFDAPAQFAELQAYRDPSYPYKPGDWYYGSAPLLEIGRVAKDKVTAGQATEVGGEITGPGKLGLRYVLLNPATGKIVAGGEVQPGANGRFTVRIGREATTGLTPGVYKLSLAAFSDEVATLAERIVDLEVVR